MKRTSAWVPFDLERLDAAAKVLSLTRNEAMSRCFSSPDFTIPEAIRAIQTELSKDVSAAFLLEDDGGVVGYAVATVSEDPTWSRSGWLHPGAYAVLPGYERALPELYALIGRAWLDRGILDHKVFTFVSGDGALDTWGDLGFAKQQTYAVIDLSAWQDPDESAPSGLRVRPAESSDAPGIADFSRCIASFQAAGPCFAPVPDDYLHALDKGFAELLDDEDAEVLVAESDGGLVGIAILYPASGNGLFLPKGGAELSVAAVKPEYRGTGIGTALARAAFSDQQDRGRSCVLTDWRCANPLSSRFWVKTGFEPVAHRLFRRLDPLCLEVPAG